MYINLKLLQELNLTPQSVAAMQVIVQNRTEEINDKTISSVLPDIPKEYITSIKGKKTDSDLSKIRLTAQGKKLLENIGIPDVGGKDLQLAEFLMEQYMSHEDGEDRKLGNKKLVRQYCSILRNFMGLSHHEFYYLLEHYLDNHKYTKVLEYCFHKPQGNFYQKFENNIEGSSIYQHYQNNEEEIRTIYSQKIK